MVEPHLQSSPSPQSDGTVNRPISQQLCCNSISIWSFLPRAAVTLVNFTSPEPSNLDPSLLHTPMPPSFIKLFNPEIKKEKEKGGGVKKKGIKKSMGEMEKGY